MASSTGKTIALVLLVLFILFAAIRMTPLFFAPFGWVRGVKHIFQLPHIDVMDVGPHFFRVVPISLFYIILTIIWIAVTIWVYRDAENRGMNGILWALLVLIAIPIGLLIYLIVRTDTGSSAQQETRAGPSSPKDPTEPIPRESPTFRTSMPHAESL